MKEFHQWVSDMANSIPDASEIMDKDVADRAEPPCICDTCHKLHNGPSNKYNYYNDDYFD